MQMFTDVLLVLTIAAETFCLRIELANPVTDSPCTSNAARSGKDTFKIDVNIFGDISESLSQNYNQLFSVMVIRYSQGIPLYLCSVNMTVTPCQDVSFKYCTCYPVSGGMRIAASIPLEAKQNMGVFRAHWLHDDGSRIFSPNYTFPEVYDPSAASLTATINGVAGEAQSSLCSFEVTLYKSQTLKVCCNSDLRPCYVMIVINDQEIAKDVSPCHSYVPPTDVTGVVTLSYSVCVKTEYGKSNKCSLPKVLPTSTTTSMTTSTTTSMTTTTLNAAVTTPTISKDGLTTYSRYRPTGTDKDVKTTDVMALSTGFAKEVNTGDLGILFWIIVAIAGLAAILASLAYCMISRRRSRPDEGPTAANGRTSAGRRTPQAESPTPSTTAVRTTETKDIIEEQRMSMESSSVALTGTDV